MLHIHAVIRGEYWEARGRNSPMHRECRKAGWGFPAPRRHAGIGTYASKNAVYTSKHRLINYREWRAWNGDVKPWHWSRGYTRGVAMRDWVRAYTPPADPGPWRVVQVRDLPPEVVRRRRSDETAAALIWPAVQRAVLREAMYDAVEGDVRAHFAATDDPADLLARERRLKLAEFRNAFSGMPRGRWRPDGF